MEEAAQESSVSGLLDSTGHWKLVRDGIIKKIEASGAEPRYRVATPEELMEFVCHKKDEEWREVSNAQDRDSRVKELADYKEVCLLESQLTGTPLESITVPVSYQTLIRMAGGRSMGITEEEVERARLAKATTVGTFKEHYLLWMEGERYKPHL